MIDRIPDRFLRLIEASSAALSISLTVAADERREVALLDTDGVELIHQVTDDLGLSSLILPTVAGHDALALQKLVPASLIFVPSRDGLSHNPCEYTEPEAPEKGLAVLTETLWRMVTQG